ncbi:MAG: hypothetical protein NTZ83_03825 [Candidatus Pacearchaeota archaeon]|nr:hypothetical protein [Candidatus Pacearchaeota archaeon]
MKNLLTKYQERLGTYTAIVDYFIKNPNQILTQISRLEDLQRELMKPIQEKIDVSDENIQEKVRVICLKRGEFMELSDRLHNIVTENVKERLRLNSLNKVNQEIMN